MSLMRRIAAFFLALAFGSMLAACANMGLYTPTVRTAVDPGADFSGVRTYSWIAPPDAAPAQMQQRVVDGIDARLQAAGWRRVPANGNVHIDAHVSSTEKETPNARASQTGYIGWGGFGPPAPNSRMEMETIEVGTLVVDIYDGKTRREMWRGSATGTLRNSPERVDAQLQSALDRMFAGFPPGRAAK